VIHVPNRPNVHVRLRPVKLLLGHVRPLYARPFARETTSSAMFFGTSS
jgi:hypothetical protein